MKTKKDGWTVVTKDKKLSAQWEHTILITESGFGVLTLRDEEVNGPVSAINRETLNQKALSGASVT